LKYRTTIVAKQKNPLDRTVKIFINMKEIFIFHTKRSKSGRFISNPAAALQLTGK
jgi:hypothetical protein